jgi:hypothetical protein
MRFLPYRSWWLTPSGGPYPKPWSLFTILTEAPLPAHLLGALVMALWIALDRVLPGNVQLWERATAAMILWQAFNVERLGWARYGFVEVFWRVAIGAVPLGIVLGVLELVR